MAEKENKELDEWIKFLNTNPTFGQFNAKVAGRHVTAEMLYSLWATKSENKHG